MDADGPRLLLGHTATGVTDTLGPGRRSVVWVQGCHIGCPGCIVPESWGFDRAHGSIPPFSRTISSAPTPGTSRCREASRRSRPRP